MDARQTSFVRLARTRLSRRHVLGVGGVMISAAALQPILAACGGGSTSTPAVPTATATNATATTTASTTSTPVVTVPPSLTPSVTAPPATGTATGTSTQPAGAAVVNVKASEAPIGFIFDVDRQSVPAGPVTFNFTNNGKLTHEVMVYPTQDLSAMLTKKRAGDDVDENEYIKALAGSAMDIDPGKTATFDATLEPGFYELSCQAVGKNPDGTTFTHFDKGQTMTLAVVGSGGPSADILTPAAAMKVDMVPGTGDIADSWLFRPDRLMVNSGDVKFDINNTMDMTHDFTVYPIGDIAAFVTSRFNGDENYDMIKGQVLAEDLESGKSASASAKLTPGWWVATCFVVSKNPDGTSYLHRDKGQRFTFLVK